MKISILSQLMQIALSLLLGFSSGFLYDTFKVLRRNSGGKAFSAFMDALFCLVVCFALFVMGMSAGEGSLDLAMFVFAFAGFGCYMLLLSDRVFASLHRAFGKIKSGIAKAFSPIEIVINKLAETAKMLFSKIIDRFRIKSIFMRGTARKRKLGGNPDGEGKSEHNSGHCNYGDDSLWRVQSDRSS